MLFDEERVIIAFSVSWNHNLDRTLLTFQRFVRVPVAGIRLFLLSSFMFSLSQVG
jgi:hypothetical protein